MTIRVTEPAWPDARILIIDDDISHARLLERLLARGGYTNLQVMSDDTQALHEYETFRPDLVLLDLHMPRIDGFTLLRQMQELTRTASVVPVLVITGDTAPESRQRAQVLGASDYLLKPYDLNEVCLRVDALLELRAHAQAGFREAHELYSTLEHVSRRDAVPELQLIERLAEACACHDCLSEGHIQRVGELSATLARELGLPESTVEAIGVCAPLHDLGKIAIPAEILQKPGVLTPEEMQIAERHAGIGALIMSSSASPLLRFAADIALTHHERWDGSGYPRGLVGERIPLAGRIVAVADVFDALTHARPYKKAWSMRRALAHMQDQRGRDFDPDVLDALLRVKRDSASVSEAA